MSDMLVFDVSLRLVAFVVLRGKCLAWHEHGDVLARILELGYDYQGA